MFTTRFNLQSGLRWAALLGLLVAGAGCQGRPGPQPAAEYVKSVEDGRKNKDKMFREDSSSPVPPAARAQFTGLSYYSVDINYRAERTAKRYAKEETVEMLTSQGTLKTYTRYAYIDVIIGGQPARLTIYSLNKDGKIHYFLPFKDATNGSETYPAGRYLEVEIEKDWRTVVDFNQAYNPYCAYNHDYACPIPPPENHLKIPIKAGERYVEPKS